jgi:hypothetical protein
MFSGNIDSPCGVPAPHSGSRVPQAAGTLNKPAPYATTTASSLRLRDDCKTRPGENPPKKVSNRQQSYIPPPPWSVVTWRKTPFSITSFSFILRIKENGKFKWICFDLRFSSKPNSGKIRSGCLLVLPFTKRSQETMPQALESIRFRNTVTNARKSEGGRVRGGTAVPCKRVESGAWHRFF